MHCDEVKDRLYEFIYDELKEEKKLEIEEHLSKCESCSKAYRELKTNLIDDMEPIFMAKESIKMPSALPQRVRKKLFGNPVNRLVKYASAACIALTLFYTVPVAAYYFVQNSPLQKYVGLDTNIEKEFEQGKGQLIQKSSTMKGITFTVDGIIKGDDSTTILFTAKLPVSEEINYAMPSMMFNVVTVEDQFGTKYDTNVSSMTLETVNEDGEIKGLLRTDPIKFWTYKLSVRVTAMEIGKMLVSNDDGSIEGKKYDMKKLKNVYGSWTVDFYIKK